MHTYSPNGMAFDKILTCSDFLGFNIVRTLLNDKTFIFSISYAFPFGSNRYYNFVSFWHSTFMSGMCRFCLFFPLRFALQMVVVFVVVDRFIMLIFNDCLIFLKKKNGIRTNEQKKNEKRKKNLIPKGCCKALVCVHIDNGWNWNQEHTHEEIAINFFLACCFALTHKFEWNTIYNIFSLHTLSLWRQIMYTMLDCHTLVCLDELLFVKCTHLANGVKCYWYSIFIKAKALSHTIWYRRKVRDTNLKIG